MSSNNNNNSNIKLINNLYVVKRRISAGSFGVVHIGQEINTKHFVAIKIEKETHTDSSLDREAEILKRLQGIPQIPKLFFNGREQDSNVLVISYLGRDLTHYMKKFRKFSLKCVLNIAEQMINAIENIHKNKVIHRDIKPENVLVGKDDESHILYVVDFGISKFYKDENDSHISYREHLPFIGTTRYASISAHKGQSLSRKDDLESLGYMLIFLLKGQLPWQNLQYTSEEDKIKQVGQMKIRLETTELSKGIPIEFGRFIDYVRGLPFKSEPNYKYCLSLFRKVAIEHTYTPKELIFDWETGSKQDISFKKIQKSESKPSLYLFIFKLLFRFKKRNDEHSSGHVIGSLINNSIQDAEMNSLLKTPDQKKSTLTPDINRKQNRMASVSSYNSGSEIDFNNSVMLGVQPSMISRLSKISFNSNSRVKDSYQQLSPQPQRQNKLIMEKKKLSIQPSQYINRLCGDKPHKPQNNSNSQIPSQLDMETIGDFSKLNECDEELSIEDKYQQLKINCVHARFKKQINKLWQKEL